MVIVVPHVQNALYEHVYSHRGSIKTVKNKITIKEKKKKRKIKMK